MELYLPPIVKKEKRHLRPRIIWTPEKLNTLKNEFPFSFTRDIAKKLGVSYPTIRVKAKELGLKKEDGFLEKNRKRINELVSQSLIGIPRPAGWIVPNSERTRFKPGHKPRMSYDPDVVEKNRKTRADTVRSERIRIKLGFKQKTKLRLLA